MGIKSIGQSLKEIRTKKKMSIDLLSSRTKIRREFLEAIEKENWNALPDFPVVLGFVKSIAGVLKMSTEGAVSLLKRDYPPKDLRISPKPDVSKSFVWSPRLTFWMGIVVVSVCVVSYLIYQYISFISPPKLLVNFPREGQKVTELKLSVSGSTESDATVKVNNQPVLVNDDGNFWTEVEVTKDTKEIVVVSDSRSGKETVIHRNINVEINN